jgi:hypothetical protein
MLLLLFPRSLPQKSEDQTTLARFHQELVARFIGVLEDLRVRGCELVDQVVCVEGDCAH